MSFAPLLNAAKYLPSSVVLKGLEKISPKFKNFFTEAASYGYDADRALDYLVNRFSNPASQQYKQDLAQGAQQGTLRPDEQEAMSQVQSSEAPGRLARGIASFGGAGLAGVAKQAEEQAQQQQTQDQNKKRQSTLDQEAIIHRQNEDIARKDSLGFKKRAEERAIEKHKASMNKPAMKSAMKKKIPEDYGQALAEFDALINRL